MDASREAVMAAGEFDWAGYGFFSLGHADGHFIRTAGVFAFVKRVGSERCMLFADQAEYMNLAAGPSHPRWSDALSLGMCELHVFTRARDRTERLLVLDRVIRRCLPILNVIEPTGPIPLGLVGPVRTSRSR